MLAFPKIACNKMTSSRFGMLKKISVKRMSSESTHSGAHPLTEPKTIASTVERNVASTPIKSEIRPHTRSWKNISPHRICPKEKLSSRCLIVMCQVHIAGIFCHDQMTAQAA